jgi:hypothetical protein
MVPTHPQDQRPSMTLGLRASVEFKTPPRKTFRVLILRSAPSDAACPWGVRQS